MEKISAWIDGEAGEYEGRQVVAAFKRDAGCCETYAAFHLIGDVMRGEPVLRDDFSARLRSRLNAEPTILAPRFTLTRVTKYALSAAASLAAVGFVTLLVTTANNPLRSQDQVAAVSAQQQTTVASAKTPAQSASEQSVNEYLMAHQEFSPSTAMQGVAPYIRTVADDDNR